MRLATALIAALAFAALIASAVFWPRAVAAGWLCAFAYWASIPLGGLALVMIHRLTGGRWGDVIAPVTLGTARAVPLLWLGIIPVFVAIPVLFDWHGARPDVLAHYLNLPFYVVRSVVILAGLTLFSLAMVRGRGRLGLPAVGLIFYAFVINIISLDWILAVEPQAFFTAFGAATAVEQLSAVLAWTVLMLPDMPRDVRRDLGALMLATVLASIYMNYMDFMIIWYGDVPHKIAWFLARSDLPWKAFFAAGVLFGGLGPLFALLFSRTRFLPDDLRPIALSMLVGYACYEMWQVLPDYGLIALPFAVVAMIGIAALAVSLSRREAAHA